MTSVRYQSNTDCFWIKPLRFCFFHILKNIYSKLSSRWLDTWVMFILYILEVKVDFFYLMLHYYGNCISSSEKYKLVSPYFKHLHCAWECKTHHQSILLSIIYCDCWRISCCNFFKMVLIPNHDFYDMKYKDILNYTFTKAFQICTVKMKQR